MMSIPAVFASLACSPRSAAAIALRSNTEALSFAELWERSGIRARELARSGVQRGDVVALLGFNEVAFFEHLIALGRLEAALLPLSPALPNHDLAALISCSNAVIVQCSPLVDPTRVAELNRLVGCSVATTADSADLPDDFDSSATGSKISIRNDDELPHLVDPASICWISTTGGSTGTPKLYAISHERLLSNLFVNATEWGWASYDDYLALSPLAHGIGFCHSLGHLITGGTVVLVERYSPQRAADAIAESSSIWTAIVPTMLHDVIGYAEAHSVDLSSLGLVVAAGAQLFASLRERIFKNGSSRRLIEYYGSTELGWITWINHTHGDSRNGLVGYATRGSLVRVVDDVGVAVPAGEIGMIQKLGRPYAVPFAARDQFAAGTGTPNWESSGDMGYFDEDGALVLVGRQDDMIIVGGQNLYPAEVEAVLREHSAVNEVIVIGMLDARLGRELVAFVEPKGTAGEELIDELIAFSSERLARYKRPKLFALMTALPRTASGKTNRNSVLLHR